MLPNPASIKSLISWGTAKIDNSPAPLLETEILLANSLSRSKTYLVTHPEEILPLKKMLVFQKNISRRKQQEPIAYIINSKEFYGREFYVDHRVLIPRPESEGIIDIVKHRLSKKNIQTFPQIRIADLGTGSGCLAITLSLELTSANVFIEALDKSPQTLTVARKNWQRLKNGSHNMIEFIKKDLLKDRLCSKFDIIISNPPYIKDNEIADLDKDITGYEPKTALSGGTDGLVFYRRFARILKQHLTSTGFAVLEINSDLVLQTKAVFANEYGLELLPDLSGRPRYLILTFRQ